MYRYISMHGKRVSVVYIVEVVGLFVFSPILTPFLSHPILSHVFNFMRWDTRQFLACVILEILSFVCDSLSWQPVLLGSTSFKGKVRFCTCLRCQKYSQLVMFYNLVIILCVLLEYNGIISVVNISCKVVDKLQL